MARDSGAPPIKPPAVDKSRVDKSMRWGTMMGPIPQDVKRRALRGDRQLNNRPLDIIHNHARGRGRVKYAGYCQNAPMYHLFRCVALSDPPRRKVVLKTFDQRRFTTESKAGRGGCSMRNCPGEAVLMGEKATQAYCERCAQRVQGKLPCSWTSILPCHRVMGLDIGPYGKPCPTCTGFEEKE